MGYEIPQERNNLPDEIARAREFIDRYALKREIRDFIAADGLLRDARIDGHDVSADRERLDNLFEQGKNPLSA